MKVKTSDLTGPALDWAVAQIELTQELPEDIMVWVTPLPCDDPDDRTYQPSTNWAQGGPIIEREHIQLLRFIGNEWEAQVGDTHTYIDQYSGDAVAGPTPLISAMRCLIATKLGDSVEIPAELVHASK